MWIFQVWFQNRRRKYCADTTQDQLSMHESEQNKKRARKTKAEFTSNQLKILEEEFIKTRYPDIYNRERIAKAVGLTEERVKVNDM